MSDRPDGLENELRDLGRHLDVPPPPDLAVPVRARIEAPAPRGHHRPHWVYAAAVLLLVGALVLGVTPPGRAVVAHVLHFAGIEMREGPGPTPSGPGTLPGERRTTFEDARRLVAFPLVAPSALGRPGSVIVSDGGRVASLLYSRPAGAVRLDEFDGRLQEAMFGKYVFVEPDRFRRTSVAGRPAIWISGAHVLVYVGRDGVERRGSARNSGKALIWQSGPVALRLEGIADLDQARRIAASVGRPG